jgi:ribosomal-protein-alanine N-acetyltransferase
VISAPVRQSVSATWLETRQWLLEAVSPDHAELFARLHARNAAHFEQAMHVDPQMSDAAFWVPVLERQQRWFHDGEGLFLAGFRKGAAQREIGCAISFSGIVHGEFQACWLGYRLDRALQGRGLMHDAVAPAVQQVFERYGLHRICASHLPENLRSGALLRRLGFGVEGYARDFMHTNGQWRDHVLLARLAPGA